MGKPINKLFPFFICIYIILPIYCSFSSFIFLHHILLGLVGIDGGIFDRRPPPVSGSGLGFFFIAVPQISRLISDDECERLIAALPQVHITLQVPFEISVWQQFFVICGHSALIPKKSGQRLSWDRTWDPRFACPNASHSTTAYTKLRYFWTNSKQKEK